MDKLMQAEKRIDMRYNGNIPQDLITDIEKPKYKFNLRSEIQEFFQWADVAYDGWIVNQAKNFEEGLWDLRYVILMIVTCAICLWQINLNPAMAKSLWIVMFFSTIFSIATMASLSKRYNLLLSTFLFVLLGVAVIPLFPNEFLKGTVAVFILLTVIRMMYKLYIKELLDIKAFKAKKKEEAQ